MAAGVQKAWSVTAGSNDSADSNIGLVEGGGTYKAPHVNNTQRAIMAAVKAFANQISAAKTTGGSANAYTFTSDAAGAISTSYAAGMAFAFVANHTCSGASTLNVDGVGAVAIRKGGSLSALASGDITSGGVYLVMYEASVPSFVLLNPAVQPLDATLTALAGLSTSASTYLRCTGTDAFTLDSYSTVATNIGTNFPAGTAGSPAIRYTSESNSGFYWSSSGTWGFSSGGTIRVAFGAHLSMQGASTMRSTAGSVSGASFGSASETNTGMYFIGAGNIGFTFAGTKGLDMTATTAEFSGTLRGRVATSAETSGTLTSASANKALNLSGDITINNSVFTAGDFIFVYAGASARAITAGTITTQRLSGTSTTGSLTLAARGMAVGYCLSSSEIIWSGNVS